MVSGATRDLRIDLFRGIALYMIIFDHVPGDPLSTFSYARFGFSDAAEIFVFLSGVSCGIVYSRKLLRQGIVNLIKAVSKRTLQIYCYYLLASVATILLIAVIRDIMVVPATNEIISLDQDPLMAIFSAILLISTPALPGILVLYLELTLFAIPLFLMTATVSKRLALMISGAIWIFSQFHPADFLPRLADQQHFFNPWAWQFLFCLGMFSGMLDDSDAPLIKNSVSIIAAWTIVIAGLAHKIALFLLATFGIDLGVIASYNEILRDMVHMQKQNLCALRLLHFLSAALIVATYMKPNSPVLSWPGASVIIKSGRCSLQVFSLGAVLSVLLNLFIAVERPFAFERLILDCAVILLTASIATVLMSSYPDRGQLLSPRDQDGGTPEIRPVG